MQKRVISLGKSFVKELGIENRVDTLARWMSHYVAELILKAENATGRKKKQLEKECFEVILALWKHRWTLPHGKRPLENFEPLLNLLQKLDPEKDDPYYYPEVPFRKRKTKNKKSKKDQNLDMWLNIAQNIDKIARIWLSEVLHQAAISAENPETKTWLENAISLPNDHDRQIIIRIVTEQMPDLDDEGNIEELNGRLSKETIEQRIKELEGFSKINKLMLDTYRSQLQ